MLSVLTFGAINVDTFFSVSSLSAWRGRFSWWPATGEGVVSPEQFSLTRSTLLESPFARKVYEGGGGQAGNFALAASRCGLRVVLLGAVGSDPNAAKALSGVTSVDTSSVHKRNRTGRTLVLVDPDGNRDILVDPGVNAHLGPMDIDWEAPKGARHVHCTSLPNTAGVDLQVRLFSCLSPTSTTSLDIGALYARLGMERLRHLLAGLYLIFGTQEELEIFTDASGDQCMERLFGVGVRFICCKRGADGASVYGRSGEVTVAKAPSVSAVDTTGAGDVLAGVLVAGLLRSRGDFGPSLHAAVALASQAVTSWGRTQYPTRGSFEEWFQNVD